MSEVFSLNKPVAKRQAVQRSFLLWLPFAIIYLPMVFDESWVIADILGGALIPWVISRVMVNVEFCETPPYRVDLRMTIFLCVGILLSLGTLVVAGVMHHFETVFFIMIPVVWFVFWLGIVRMEFQAIDRRFA